MNNVDYLIVGCGLAGIAFSHLLDENGLSFVVVDDASQKSSTVAGGMYNPVVLKRFTSVWKSQEQLQLASSFYKQLEEKLQIKLNYKMPILRLFNSIEEQNNWFQASDNPKLSQYIDAEIVHIKNDGIHSEYGFGKVLQTGRIDTLNLVKYYKKYLEKHDVMLQETIDHHCIKFIDDKVLYKNISAKHAVFAEGYGLKKNHFFNHLPLNGTKGELLTIHAPDLNIDFVLKSSVFVIPLGNHNYRVGATYEWEDKTNNTTPKGREELLNKLKKVLKCRFEVIDQTAGIRPTVKDRRPLVGQHHTYKNSYVLNGLGTRGVMIAPYVAQQLFNFIERAQPLNKEINIERFNSSS